MDGIKLQEDSIYLPEDIVRKSPGFTVDVGSSLIKVVYRSNKDFKAGQPINNDAVRDGLARGYMFKLSRTLGCKPVTGIIKEKCDVIRPSDSKEKFKVMVTGVGSNFYKDDLEKELNAKAVTAMEHHCASLGFMIMADILTLDELVYPIPEEDLDEAKGYAEMYGGYFEACGTTSQENFSRLTHCEAPIPEGSKPYLPCLLSTCGSGNIIMKLDEDGNRTITDCHGIAGIAFLGFASYNHGPISFEDLISKLKATDGGTVDAMVSDIVASGSDSDYAKMKGDRRILPYAKLPGIKDPEKVKKEDMTYSFLRTIAEVQGHLVHVHSIAHRVRKAFLVGSFIDITLVRRFLTEEIQGRNLLRPKSQQVKFHFVKGGGYMVAIGAFAEGAKLR